MGAAAAVLLASTTAALHSLTQADVGMGAPRGEAGKPAGYGFLHDHKPPPPALQLERIDEDAALAGARLATWLPPVCSFLLLPPAVALPVHCSCLLCPLPSRTPRCLQSCQRARR